MGRSPRAVWAALLALCTLSASAWLLPLIDSETYLLGSALAFSVLGLSAVIVEGRVPGRRKLADRAHHRASPHRRHYVLASVFAVGAVAGPVLLLETARSLVEPSLGVAMLGLSPVAAGVTLAVMRGQAVDAMLLPSLVAVAGVLLLVPISEPASVRATMAVVAAMAIAVAVGISAVVSNISLRTMRPARAFLVTASANAVVLWAAAVINLNKNGAPVRLEAARLVTPFLFELCGGTLTLWLLWSMPPLAYTTRYLWTPLIVALEGYILLRPPLSWRVITGACLIVGGGVFLLRNRSDVTDEILPLR